VSGESSRWIAARERLQTHAKISETLLTFSLNVDIWMMDVWEREGGTTEASWSDDYLREECICIVLIVD